MNRFFGVTLLKRAFPDIVQRTAALPRTDSERIPLMPLRQPATAILTIADLTGH